VKCPHCQHDGHPAQSGPYDRDDGSSSVFYVCRGCDQIVPGTYVPPPVEIAVEHEARQTEAA
jgi:hypothetical protein